MTNRLCGALLLLSLVASGECLSAQNCVTPPPGLRAWWTLDEPSGNVAHDRAGFDNAGTYGSSPLVVPGQVENALEFEGEPVVVPDHPELDLGTSNFSIDVWIRTHDTPGLAPKPIVEKLGPGGGFSVFLLNDRFGITICSAGGGCASPTVPFSSVADGAWHLLAVTVDRDTVNGGALYLDGVKLHTFDATQHAGKSIDNSVPLEIGPPASGGGGISYLEGALDELEIFGRALTAAEVQSLFAAGPAGKCRCGVPSLIQSNYFTKGNFEVVAPDRNGGVIHYWRHNDAPGFPWTPTVVFGQSLGAIDAVSLIQSNYFTKGNFEAIVRAGGQLAHFWRHNDASGFPWFGPTFFGAGVTATGTPSLVQSNFGFKGDFEVVVPVQSGLARFTRNNDAGNVWSPPELFGSGLIVQDVSLIQTNINDELHVVARIGTQLAHFFRTPAGWQGPTYFASGVSGAPAVVQSNFGIQGNFEVVAPMAAGGMAHWFRDNDHPQKLWHGPASFGAGRVHSVTLIQSNFDQNLEVVAQRCDQLEHWWRESQAPFPWHSTVTINP